MSIPIAVPVYARPSEADPGMPTAVYLVICQSCGLAVDEQWKAKHDETMHGQGAADQQPLPAGQV